jgi:hypothetical protein
MSDPRLSMLAIELETIRKRLSQIDDPHERKVLLREMRERLQQADRILKDPAGPGE